MKLIVGLGNPGKEYKNTRHNVGFAAVDKISRHFGFEDAKGGEKFKAKIAQGTIVGEKVFLVKPQTFMNLSGEAVQPILHYYKMFPNDLIVIYDDFIIAPGTLRIRPGGSSGGHQGMNSIINLLGTEQFIRIRIGIAPFNAWQGTNADYVLGRLSPQEQEIIGAVVDKMPDVIETIIKEDVEKAMTKFNGEAPR